MASTDAFTAQIVQLVRQMPDDAILALVKNQLGAVVAPASAAAASRAPQAAAAPRRKAGRPKKVKAAPKKVAAKKPAAKKPAAKKPAAKKARKPVRKAKAPARAKAGRRASGGRADTLSAVERIVRGSNGLAASEVAKSAGVPQTRVAAALKELKLAKRIFQGGDRRFARYAGDPKTADQASVAARRNASGPLVKKRGRR